MNFRLSDYAAAGVFDVIRDATFKNLGFLTSPADGLVVAIGDDRWISRLPPLERVAAILTTPSLAEKIPASVGLATCENPMGSLFQVHVALADAPRWDGHLGATEIDPSARVHPTASIAPMAVRIGADSIVGPRAVIQERVEVGRGCVIHAGAALGVEGYEVREVGDRRIVVPHVGGVKIHDDVEVMANSCVCRSLFGQSTEIGEGTKVDNLVHVAHDVRIGRRCKIVAHTMLGGSTTIGDDVWVGPNASISNGLTIGKGAFVTLGAVVTRDVAPGARVTGHFAIDHPKWMEFVKSVC